MLRLCTCQDTQLAANSSHGTAMLLARARRSLSLISDFAMLVYSITCAVIVLGLNKNLRTQFVFRFAHISFERVNHSQSLPQMMLDDLGPSDPASEAKKEPMKKKRRRKRRRSKQKIKKIIVHRFHRPSVTKIEDSEEEHTLDRLPGVDLETGI